MKLKIHSLTLSLCLLSHLSFASKQEEVFEFFNDITGSHSLSTVGKAISEDLSMDRACSRIRIFKGHFAPVIELDWEVVGAGQFFDNGVTGQKHRATVKGNTLHLYHRINHSLFAKSGSFEKTEVFITKSGNTITSLSFEYHYYIRFNGGGIRERRHAVTCAKR